MDDSRGQWSPSSWPKWSFAAPRIAPTLRLIFSASKKDRRNLKIAHKSPEWCASNDIGDVMLAFMQNDWQALKVA